MTMKMTEIVNLMKNGKQKEAQKALAEYLAGVKLSGEDRGSVYAETASAYLKANNNFLAGYNGFLKEIIKELRLLKEKEGILSRQTL